MEPKIAYDIKLTKDFFCATFINIESLKQSVCYMLGETQSNMGILPKIIDSCLLIGYGNKLHNDIVLNFYYHHRESSASELYTFSRIIHKEVGDLWRNPQIEYYMYKNVNSIDMSWVIETKNNAPEGSLEANLDTLINQSMSDTKKIVSMVEEFKKDQNYGFKKSHKATPTSESCLINYIMRKL